MITDLDKNKNNSIDFEEFLDMMTARMSDRDTREDIKKVFRLFDDDGTGTISIRNLRRVARELGETMTDEELQEMIDRADSNGDSAVTPDDFYNIMTKKTFVWATFAPFSFSVLLTKTILASLFTNHWQNAFYFFPTTYNVSD